MWFWFEGMVDLFFYIDLVLNFFTAYEVRQGSAGSNLAVRLIGEQGGGASRRQQLVGSGCHTAAAAASRAHAAGVFTCQQIRQDCKQLSAAML